MSRSLRSAWFASRDAPQMPNGKKYATKQKAYFLSNEAVDLKNALIMRNIDRLMFISYF